MAKRKTYRLKKDVVIPAGTVLRDFSGDMISLGDNWAGRPIRFTIDSYGYFLYGVYEEDEYLSEWIEEVESDEEEDEYLSEWIEEVESDEELDWVLIV